ncbi:MAG TPA: DMT family transporter, partial [Thermomicrobiales bacterium]|nr:DMT family transporter [Thermomicrobiales bacterium]
LDRTSPFSSSLLIAMVPLFTVVILAILGERTPPQSWLGIAVAVVGVVVFLLEKWGDRGSLAGDALSLGAAVSFALYGVVNRPLVARYPPATYTAWTLLLGAIPLLVIAAPAALAQPWRAVSGAAWLGMLYMAIFPVYIAYQLWNWAIHRRGAATATTFSLLVPIVSGVLSAVVFHEGFGAAKLCGAALVLAGLVIVRMPRRRPAGEGST